MMNTNITNIRGWSLQPFSQDCWPSFSYHLCCVCVNFTHKWRKLQSTENDRFFEKLLWQFLFTFRIFARNLLRGNRRGNTFCILFWCLAWCSNPGFSSNKPILYLLDHGNLIWMLKMYMRFLRNNFIVVNYMLGGH